MNHHVMDTPNEPLPSDSKSSLLKGLSCNIKSIKDLMSQNFSLEKQLEDEEEEIKYLKDRIDTVKFQRDLIIGQRYAETRQKSDESLENTKTALENTLVRVKQEYGKISEEVFECEDVIENLIKMSKDYDSRIAGMKNELEKIKVIAPPSEPASANRCSVPTGLPITPIQLSRRTVHLRKAISYSK
jgi:chromosome segregation ATPase